jgi:tRNA U54 and U55 pseudouridine synthase Pus10
MTDNSEQGFAACEKFQQQLPTLMQAGGDLYDHPHARNCELCRALLDDLERIAEEARHRFGSEY